MTADRPDRNGAVIRCLIADDQAMVCEGFAPAARLPRGY